jgi:alpha-galactosidase
MIARTTAAGRRAWLLRTRLAAMLLSLGEGQTGSGGDTLLLDHWGADGASDQGDDYLPSLPRNRSTHRQFLDGVPQVFPVYGDPSFKEPCLAVVFEDGMRIVRLALTADEIAEPAEPAEPDRRPTLTLTFEDPVYRLRVTLGFELFEQHDVIRRTVRLENAGQSAVRVERILSGSIGLPPGAYDAWTLHGQWGAEYRLTSRALGPGKLVMESRRGFTSHEANPWIAIGQSGGQAGGLAGQTSEEHGRVWFNALAWSGNWTIVAEVERNDALNLAIGINPFDFAWHLAPGETFEAPALLCGYSEEGLGGAARRLHAFEVDAILPARTRETLRPVLYNSWEATHFDVQVEPQVALARQAAAMGVELFVVDDGWFGARDHDRAGLGDWVVNPRTFPNGLGELIDAVRGPGGLGMQFGIWVEPEMVNADSDLYRAHPDWVFHFPGRDRTTVRHQLVLNFAREDVRAHMLGQLQRLLREHRIDFIKWDHNRPYTEVGWPSAPLERQREVWVRHVRGVYAVLHELKREFPSLLIESCAGGGGRADLGILALTDQVWTSDNTEAADRLLIQHGYSHAYAARTMVNWVTDVPNQQTGREAPLGFRFDVAMMGVLGIGGNILAWSPADLELARQKVALYKRIRPTVQHGQQFWLADPGANEPSAVQYVSEDRAQTVVLAYQVRGHLGRGHRRAHLRGLDPARRYRRVDTGSGAPTSSSTGAGLTGAGLMGAGLTGAGLMGAGLPLFADRPLNALDWLSEVQVWEDGSVG